MSRKRGIVTRSQSISTESGPPAPKKVCLPLGDFSLLPLEITEKILSALPMGSLVNLACTSREWMKFFETSLSTARTVRIITSIFSSRLTKQEKQFTAWCLSFGRFIRVITLFTNNGRATRLKWLQRILAELGLKWRSPETKMLGFGAFFNSCFKFSDPEELDQVIEVVSKKMWMGTYVRTLLKYNKGVKKAHEASMRHICLILFKDNRILQAAMKFFYKKKKFERWMTNKDLARLIYVMSGPVTTKKGTEQIGWNFVSDSPISVNSMANLAKFLNLSFWREPPFSIEGILTALLDCGDCCWSSSAIAALMVNLDIELAIPYLMEKSFCADILVDVGLHSPGTMTAFLDRLKKVLNVEAIQELRLKMCIIIQKEIACQETVCKETCGVCSDCPVCPMEDLEKIKFLIETLTKPVPETFRRSERLRAVERKSYQSFL